ncbi:hypothetical protein GFS24_01515 [Chitinophaga sp. SYP-B3965]|uniref:hypothetical protein n=1 Tax=Chitinophaga sp. SYP-B3965 TaxID=2663120 RepID=UPI0012998912|nr:hypothetical protein [Chitinophaga sp. SYP-B3965]MRG43768.1 hypothetical protein [Chitinophaga sp. SYP-B3965]
MATLILYIAGIYSLGFAIFHMLFWKAFRWKEDLQHLRSVNRAIIQILNTRIIYFLLLCAFLCFFFADELLATRLGQVMLIGIALFWAGRTVEQFIFLRAYYVLTAIFILGTMLFSLPLFL